MRNARERRERAFLINREIDAIRGTIFRQTMFAEFEKITHELAEQDEPLTVDRFKSVYRELLEALFRARLRARSGAVAGVLPHSAFLSRVLRLQVRHRPVGRDRPGRARHDRRPTAQCDDYLSFLQGRLLERPARPAARRRRRHGKARAGRHGAGLLRPAGRGAGRAVVGPRSYKGVTVAPIARTPV